MSKCGLPSIEIFVYATLVKFGRLDNCYESNVENINTLILPNILWCSQPTLERPFIKDYMHTRTGDDIQNSRVWAEGNACRGVTSCRFRELIYSLTTLHSCVIALTGSLWTMALTEDVRYAYKVEWSDKVTRVVWDYQLNLFPESGEIEMVRYVNNTIEEWSTCQWNAFMRNVQ